MVIGKQVEDVMTKDVVTVGPGTPVLDIVRTILNRRLSGLPVIDNHSRVVGVVSEADLLLIEEYRDSRPPRRLESGHRREERAKSSGTVARDLMTSPAITALVGTSVFEAARAMHRNGVKRLPVVDTTGKLVGIVTRSDLLKVFLPTDEDIRLSVEYGLLDPLWPLSGKVTVAVDEGVVTLSGRMELRAEVDLLTKLAGSLGGVVSVNNRLEFQKDDLSESPSRAHSSSVSSGTSQRASNCAR
jgi:CBS domain-containing protein